MEKLTKADKSNLCKQIIAGNTNVLETLQNKYPDLPKNLYYEKTGDSILHIACRLGALDFVRHLLTTNPNYIHWRNKNDKTALHEAAQFSHPDLVHLLLNHGADPYAVNRGGWTPVLLACTKRTPQAQNTLKAFLTRGVCVEIPNDDGWGPAHVLCREGNVEMFRLVPPTRMVPTKNGRTPLHIAALHGHAEMVRELLSVLPSDTDVDCVDTCGNTPLHDGVLGGDVGVCELLCGRGADFRRRNKCGYGLVHLAAFGGSLGVVRFVVRGLGLDVNERSEELGVVALHCAAKKDCRAVYELLVELGADTECLDAFGRKPSDYFSW